ncbi:tetratricopeptide repeat protein, partial [Sphingopyxis sp.]|uniref:tetratricopeptide repeat protein n=1 Tax=Sphingopyxis sp. TaxID=1908224 RepID=UPI0039C8DD3D
MNSGHLAEAVAALQSGHPARAEALVRHHLGAAPDDPEALRLLAAAAVAAGRFVEAEPLLERAI